ncbi:unnamed protein product [Aphanomyces euteiches]
MCNWLWTESFEDCVRQCLELQKLKGYATMDLLDQVYNKTNELELPPAARMYIYDQLAHLEHRLATGTSETLQLMSLVKHLKALWISLAWYPDNAVVEDGLPGAKHFLF